MNGFERRKDRKKENIRQVALELFSSYGVQKVSIAEIAKNANVSQVTIYNYFGSKDGLLYDVISDVLDKYLQEFTQIMESGLPFPEIIDIFISEKTKDLAMMNPEFLKLMLSNEPVIRQTVEDFASNKYIPLVLEFIERGKKEGYINKDISNETILIYFTIFKEAKYNKPELFIGQNQSEQLYNELSTLFYYGLMGKPENRK
jgi:AcrR family transcriptional regulator